MKIILIIAAASFLFVFSCAKPKKAAPLAERPSAAPEPVEAVPSADVPATPEEVTRVQDLINKILGNKVFFDFDKSEITDDGKQILSEVGDIMKTSDVGRKINVDINGHTDVIGTEEYNMALGERRAQAVMQYLESYGVEEGRITIKSFGEELPASEGSDPDSHAQNRRAEFRATARLQ
ncbi:OmpA family protein [Fibrobacterota bacterium]